MKKIFLILLMLFLWIFSQVSAWSKQTQPEFSGNWVLWNNWYELSSSEVILKHGICKQLTKVGTKNVFVPLKTAWEWQSFYTKVPSSVATVWECSCLATSLDGYSVGVIFHWASITSTKSLPPPLHASSANKTGTFSCNGWVTTLISETSDNITCNAWYSWNGASCVYVPSNCSAGSLSWYNYSWMTHWNTQWVSKVVNGSPANGITNYNATASCNDGSVSISWETSSPSCNAWYTWNGSSCAAPIVVCISDGWVSWSYASTSSSIPSAISTAAAKCCSNKVYESGTQYFYPLNAPSYYIKELSCWNAPPSNCSAGSQNWYSYASLTHGNSQWVNKVVNGAPANGQTNYTATATCNNGNITITWETPSTTCNTGYTWNGAACVMIVAPKCYNVNITYNMTTDYIGTSWSYNWNKRCKSNDFWTMKSITDCSSWTPKIPYSNGSFWSSSCAYTFNQYWDYWGHFSCIEVTCP